MRGDVITLNIIPKPKKIENHEGYLKSKAISIVNIPEDKRIINSLSHLYVTYDGIPIEFIIGDKVSEAYTLSIECEKITIQAEGNAGVFYAIQTLKQLFQEEKVPCCYIEDEPDFKYRGFYHDITRGRVPKLETLKKLVDEMAYYKMNSLQLYVEHTSEKYKEQIILSAEGVAVMAELLAVHAGHYIRRKTNTQKWVTNYKEKWLLDSKDSELKEIEKMFLEIEKVTIEKEQNK